MHKSLSLNLLAVSKRRSLNIVCALLMLLATTSLHAAGGFTGSITCASCHAKQYQNWKGSHHELAMQHASDKSVLGDFDNAQFTHNGVTSHFFRKDGKFFVNTDGQDGSLQDFEIKYTIGVTPLQQYLVEFPVGRVQTLSITWDSRPTEDGGQRWYHIYPDETIDHEDELHWTGPQQNWNFMCADCHSTNLRKGYSAAKDSFKTTWSEISVGCEACHGPGEQHVAWAGQPKETRSGDTRKGLALQLTERNGVQWVLNADSGTAQRSAPNETRREIEVCASCHSRRGIIREGAAGAGSFLDHYLPALLTDPLYHADGQIRDEVYVWGSFIQSNMHATGVTCSDCHDPHSQQLRATGDAVCAQCHLPLKFAVAEHHHHEPGSTGANCLDCHMPETTYMVVDPRRDHSMRIPRPDRSVEYGTPNACTQCHSDRDERWAADRFTSWYPEPKQTFQNWAQAFVQARQGDPGAGPALASLVRNAEVPDIARATAILELRAYLDANTVPALQAALQDASPLVRMAAVRTLDAIPVGSRLPLAGHLLQDGLLAVRTEAARVLAGTPRNRMNQAGVELLEKELGEYIVTQQLHADRVESQVNLGNLYVSLGDPLQAEQNFRRAIRLDPRFVPVYINLSDLYRAQGMHDQAVKVLKEGIAKQPGAAALHHSLGLALVRQGKTAAALAALIKAVHLAPEAARYAYVHGVALNSTGQAEAAISSLEEAHKLHPNDRDILFALTTINRDLNHKSIAERWAEKLLELNPSDTGAQQLLRSLGTGN